jgi:hypothetical protein
LRPNHTYSPLRLVCAQGMPDFPAQNHRIFLSRESFQGLRTHNIGLDFDDFVIFATATTVRRIQVASLPDRQSGIQTSNSGLESRMRSKDACAVREPAVRSKGWMQMKLPASFPTGVTEC